MVCLFDASRLKITTYMFHCFMSGQTLVPTRVQDAGKHTHSHRSLFALSFSLSHLLQFLFCYSVRRLQTLTLTFRSVFSRTWNTLCHCKSFSSSWRRRCSPSDFFDFVYFCTNLPSTSFDSVHQILYFQFFAFQPFDRSHLVAGSRRWKKTISKHKFDESA